jgi:subtilisin family serine protease
MDHSQDTLYQTKITPVDKPVQEERPRFGVGLELQEVDRLIKASEARASFQVTGAETTVAVLDTGLRTTHVDFSGRVVAQRNFTSDNGGNADDVTDGQGHGTNVGGIICADGDHLGVAPGARIIPVKVLHNEGGGSFEAIRDALQWVIDNRDAFDISAVCMSLGDSGNYTNDTRFPGDAIQDRFRTLKGMNVACLVAAGNDYFPHNSQQGMGYPAIFRETISVGAVYDENEGSFSYSSGAVAFSTAPDRITPFSQRLHETLAAEARTDIFAPGAPVTSSGILNDHGESTQHGTSQATPEITGLVLLLQEFHKKATGRLPAVDDVVTWLRANAAEIFDGDDEDDNVEHTSQAFRRAEAPGALLAARRHVQKQILCGARA